MINLSTDKEKFKSFIIPFLLGVFIFIAVAGIVLIVDYSLNYSDHRYIEVNEIYINRDNDKTLYLVTTVNGDELSLMNEDLLFIGKFNSSDIGGRLQRLITERNGHVHLKIEIRGKRSTFLSNYPNIINFKIIDETITGDV